MRSLRRVSGIVASLNTGIAVIGKTGQPGPAGGIPTGTDTRAERDRTTADSAAQHDPKALRRQIAALLPELRGFARFLARDASQADDLVQDTVVRALAAIGQYRPGTNLRAWLFTIQRNAFYEQIRRHRTEQRLLAGRVATEEVVAPHVEHRAEVEELQRLLWQLPALLREALVLVGAQEMSMEEAAAVCGVPVGTMKARVSRARAQLATLGAAGAGAGP